MSMLEIFTNIISHLITRDRIINLRNADTNGTSSILLAIQTQIANQCHLKCQYQWNPIDTISNLNSDS
jgi:chloramphenicol 3-O-phosphotransferase